MAFNFVQANAADTAGSATTLGCAITPTVGNLVVLGLGFSPITVSGISVIDSSSNPFTVTPNSPAKNTANNLGIYMYYRIATAGFGTGVSASWTTASFAIIVVAEFSSTLGWGGFDKDVISPDPSTSSGTSVTVPTITPTISGSLLYGACVPNNNVSAPAAGGTLGGWTGAVIDPSGTASEYQLNATGATAAAYTINTSSDPFASIIAAFSPPVTGTAMSEDGGWPAVSNTIILAPYHLRVFS